MKTSKGVKGFGSGSAGNLEPSQVSTNAPKAPVKGFSGGGVKGGKV